MESGLQETERAYLYTLYSSYSEKIRKLAFRRLRNEMITEDVVQNTFVWACINAKRLQVSEDAGSLLIAYAHRLTINMLKEMTTRKKDFPYHFVGDVNSGSGSVDIGLDEFFTNDLAEDERRMLHLRYEQDASVADIAKRIGISEFATKRKLKIAVRKLKTGLQFGQDLPTHPLSPEELLLFKAAEKDPTLAKLIIETADRAGFVRPEKVILLNDLVDMAGDPLKHNANAFVHHVISVNQCLTDKVIENPDFLYKMTSRQFEEFVAEMLEKKGYSVHITPATRDGGKDVIIAKQDFFSYLFYVECKKYAPDHHVGIDIIQRLYGVISAEHATGGIIATTSSFTRDAKDYIRKHNLSRQISLQDYNCIFNALQDLK